LIRKKQDHPLKNAVRKKENTIWKTVPFLRQLIPLVMGIVIEKYFNLEPIFLIPVFCLSVLLLIVRNFLSPQIFFGMDWVAGIAIQFAFFLSEGWSRMFTWL
jgi:hypothetical protein